MKRVLTVAALTLLALSSSAFAADAVVRDHRKTTAAPTTGATVRDHRTTQPYVVKGNTGATVRDHRTTTPYVVNNSSSTIKPSPVTTATGPVVRDHRNGAGSSGGVTVTSTPRPRKPKDNILLGNQPTVGGVVKGIGSSISDAGSAVMDGLGAVGNVFGIGYGSITPAKPARPQVIDHRR